MASAREQILKALYNIDENGAYSNKALSDLLQSGISAADRAFASEILMGVVRRKLQLEYIIGVFSKLKLKKLSPWIYEILKMGIYQIIFMDSVPDRAACNESVKLALKYGHRASGGYVNGVLRNVAVNKTRIEYPKDKDERIGIIYSVPAWLVKKLTEQYGSETAEKIMAASLKPQPVTVRVNRLKTDTEELVKILGEEGVKARISSENPNCVYIDTALNIAVSAAYKNGLYSLQNISSMIAAETLEPKPGETIIDMCAAPGGKAAYIAEMMENKGKVYAFDIHSHKIKLINNTANRLGISVIDAALCDACVYHKKLKNTADRVLADVPCSGIGVIHKKPEIKWRRSEKDIEQLCAIQHRISDNAAEYVKCGGTFVYSTCTILKDENEEQTRGFLERHPGFVLKEERTLHTYETGGSGFYIAKFVRTK